MFPAAFAGEEKRRMSRIYIDLKKNSQLYENKAKKLQSGICEEILPLSVVRGKKSLRGIYHSEGYRRLSDLGILEAGQILSVVEGVIAVQEKLRTNLFFPGEYILSPHAIFTDEKLEKYRIAYIPSAKERPENSLSCFVASMRRYATPDSAPYLEMLRKLAESGELGSQRLIGCIEKMKQEIRICGIK